MIIINILLVLQLFSSFLKNKAITIITIKKIPKPINKFFINLLLSFNNDNSTSSSSSSSSSSSIITFSKAGSL